MSKNWVRTLGLVISVVVLMSLIFLWRTNHLANEGPQKISDQASQTTIPGPQKTKKKPTNPYGLVAPIADLRARITKKSFGTYVTPTDSPVQPEKFYGYHTGVDVEYDDVTTDVPVHAITSGTVIYSNWVSGYGGVEILHHKIDGSTHSVIYGHLRPDSLLAVGTKVKQNQQIAVLGTAHSHETDGERRHLHFGILADSTINLRGYVDSKSELSAWLNPLKFHPKN